MDESSEVDYSPPPSPSPSPALPGGFDVSMLSANLLRHMRASSEQLRASSEHMQADSLRGSASDLDVAVMMMEAAPLETKQLYLAVARCIAYPFNAKFQVSHTQKEYPGVWLQCYSKVYVH